MNNGENDGDSDPNSTVTVEPTLPAKINQPREPEERRILVVRDEEIIQRLRNLSRETNRTVLVTSAVGDITSASLMRGNDDQLRHMIINGRHSITSIFGKVWQQREGRPDIEQILVSLNGVPGGVLRATRLEGDVELRVSMRNENYQGPENQIEWLRKERLTIRNQEDIVQRISLLAYTTGQNVRVARGTGQCSDANVFSLSLRERTENVGRAHILLLFGQFTPNNPNGGSRNGSLYTTLSTVLGGVARARRLIAYGDVELELAFG